MKSIIDILGGILTLLTGYYVYLNIIFSSEYSFEKSIKLIVSEINVHPYAFLFCSIGLFLAGSLFTKYFNKYWPFTTKNKLDVKTKLHDNLERTKKITDLRNEFFSKVFREFKSIKEYPLNPMHRLNGDFSEVNIKDISDTNFPKSDYFYKYEVFNFTEEGIELLSPNNVVGFDLLINDNNNWDVFYKYKFKKPRKGHYTKPKLCYEIYFLGYEEIMHIDWDKDPYEGNITISCHFKYKSYRRHPFKEFRYYVESPVFGFSQVEPDLKKNLAKFDVLKPFKVFVFNTRNRISRRNIKTQRILLR